MAVTRGANRSCVVLSCNIQSCSVEPQDGSSIMRSLHPNSGNSNKVCMSAVVGMQCYAVSNRNLGSNSQLPGALCS